MAEIRSALEIALEKTKNLTATEQDRKDWADEQVRRAALRLVQILRDPGVRHAREIEQTLDPLPPDQKDASIQRTRDLLVSDGNPGRDTQSLLRALGTSILPEDRELASSLQDIWDGHCRSREARRADLTRQILDDLDSRGLRGDALVANIEVSPEWERAKAEMLERWREAVREQIATRVGRSTVGPE